MRKLNRWLLTACLTLVAGTLAAQDSAFWCPATGVSYGISLKPSEHVVHVDAVTHQPATEFQLPVWNALYQVRDFAVNVNHVQVYEGVPEWLCDKCATREAQARKLDKTTWQLSTSGDHPCVTFSYDVMADDPGPFGASLGAQYGFFNWAELLVYRPDQRSAPVSMRIVDAPSGWEMRDGGVFGERSAEELENASAKASSYDRLADSPALFGKLYESSFQQGGATYHIVTDSPDVNMKALQSMLRKITGAAVEWMQDRPFDDYTFLYLVAHGIGGGGMEHAYSSAIDVGPERIKSDVLLASDVSAHEFFHLWNVKRIRPQSLEPVDYTHEQYSRALWFSEGVTNTVADILLMRAGIADETRMLNHLALVISGLESRSARLSQSVEESSFDTWFDGYPSYHRPDRSISYYNKGEILGFLIDLEMRRLTHGQRCLRDLFQYMNEHYAKQGTYFNDSEGVRQALEALTGNDFREFFAHYISGTDELPYNRYFAYVGLTLIHSQRDQVYAGFAVTHAPGVPLTIVHVDENSAAARLRLMPGDVLLEADRKPLAGDWTQVLQRHDPRSTIHLKIVAANGQPRELDLPLSVRKIDEYQFADIPGITPTIRSRRAAFLRGEAEATQQ